MKLRERYRRLNLWNKLAFWGSVASIAGLIVAVVALALPLSSSQPKDRDQPSIELTFSPRSAVLGKVQPRLAPGDSHDAVQMDVGLKNTGDVRAIGVAVTITFRRDMNARLLDKRWRRDPQAQNYAVFLFDDPQMSVYARSGSPIGVFEVVLPRSGEAEELLAVFQVHGDFARKEGLLFYSPNSDEYRWWHTCTPNEALRRWNKEVSKWNSRRADDSP